MFCGSAVGWLFISVNQRVRRLLGKAGFLLMLVHVVFLHLRVVCPYFGNFGVLVFIVFDGDGVGAVLLNGVLDLVQLLPHVVGGVVVRCCVGVTTLLSALPNAPVKGRHQATDPGHRQNGAQQWNQEICFAFHRSLLDPDFGNRCNKCAISITLADKINNFLCYFFYGVLILLDIFCRNCNMNFVVCQVGWFTDDVDGILDRNVLQYAQVPQLITDMFSSQTWHHHLFVKSERDVSTVVLIIRVRTACGFHRLLI